MVEAVLARFVCGPANSQVGSRVLCRRGGWQRYHGPMAMDTFSYPLAASTAGALAATAAGGAYKIPESVLVIIYRSDGQVLLMHRTQLAPEGVPFWQCVTGSKDSLDEDWRTTAVREVAEETGIDALAPGCTLQDWALENIYTIYPQWLHRYAPGVWLNTERVFGLRVPTDTTVCLNPREHTACAWYPWQEAADRCYSASNAEAVLHLPAYLAA